MKNDYVEMTSAEEKTPSLTFVFKYAPTEGNSNDRKVKAALGNGSVDFICRELFPGQVGSTLARATPQERSKAWRSAKQKYRQWCALGRKTLDIPEVLECAHRFSEINFGKMTSRCLKIKMKAYLNEKLKVAPMMNEEVVIAIPMILIVLQHVSTFSRPL